MPGMNDAAAAARSQSAVFLSGRPESGLSHPVELESPLAMEDSTENLMHDVVGKDVRDENWNRGRKTSKGSSDSVEQAQVLETNKPFSDHPDCGSLSPEYRKLAEYGLKLGYREDLIHSVLSRRGCSISHNELLKELIENDKSLESPESSNESIHNLQPAVGNETMSVDNASSQVVENDSSEHLRHVIVDGSNVAMSHGNKNVFSWRGIQIAVDWFKQRGHREINVFVPQWRKETAQQDSPVMDEEIYTTLEREKILVFTPSRRVNNKRIICYDDRYILNLAVATDGVVVSNDNYRDLILEKPEFKKVVEERLLMYSFVNDRFMPPEDPLGRHGPSLNAFLSRKPFPGCLSSQPCPYAKKCTYGNKCKFYHPERAQKLVSQQLAEDSQAKIKDFKRRGLDFFCNEKIPISRTSSQGPNPSSPKLPADLSSLAISLLSGGKNPDNPKRSCGLERHSLPLPAWMPSNVTHKNLRPVHSDPPKLSPHVRCSGHLALAKKISDEDCLMQQKRGQGLFFGGIQELGNNGADHTTRLDRRSVLCRKGSVNSAIAEEQHVHQSALRLLGSQQLNGTILHSLAKNSGEQRTDSNGAQRRVRSFSLAHSALTRMHSEPVVVSQRYIQNETNAVELMRSTAGPRASSQNKAHLHRVSTSPMMTNKPVSAAPVCFQFKDRGDLLAGNVYNNPCGYRFFPPGARLNANDIVYAGVEGGIAEPRLGLQDAKFRYPDISNVGNESASLSDAFSSFLMPSPKPQDSTFHFGRNSSFQFVPALSPYTGVVLPMPSGSQMDSIFSPPGSTFSHPDSTFSRLDSAFSHPDSTFSQPGSTFSHPNSSFSHPDSTFSQSGSTFSQSGSTFSQPGSAFNQMVEKSNEAKAALFVKLCGLFDKNDVCHVMEENPNETDSKVLCGHLLHLDQQRKKHQHLAQQQSNR